MDVNKITLGWSQEEKFRNTGIGYLTSSLRTSSMVANLVITTY